jgi:hypothetical protein
VPPAVVGVAPTLDQALLLELVEQPDEPAPVVAERIGASAFRIVSAVSWPGVMMTTIGTPKNAARCVMPASSQAR